MKIIIKIIVYSISSIFSNSFFASTSSSTFFFKWSHPCHIFCTTSSHWLNYWFYKEKNIYLIIFLKNKLYYKKKIYL